MLERDGEEYPGIVMVYGLLYRRTTPASCLRRLFHCARVLPPGRVLVSLCLYMICRLS